jgi:outer membrane lipoprotein-sorting protein
LSLISRRQFICTLGTGLVVAALPLRYAWGAPPAPQAVVPGPVRLNDEQKAELSQVQDYLNGIHTLSSRFTQVTPDGRMARGQIYLWRPGKMRIEYDPPVPVLLVADGSGNIFYYDREVQQVSDMRANDTPAGFLLRDKLALGGDVTVTKFQHTPGAIRVGLIETKQPGQGSVTMVLADKPLELKEWTVVDSQSKQVTVTLENPHYGAAIDPKLFYWTDPRPTGTSK